MFQRDLGHLPELFAAPITAAWPFEKRLGDLRAPSKCDDLLAMLKQGHDVKV